MSDTMHKPSLPPYLWPGIIASAVGVFGYLTFVVPLQSNRPVTDLKPNNAVAQPDSIYSAHAHLWEDPLGPTYAKLLRSSDDDGQPKMRLNCSSTTNVVIPFKHEPLVLPVCIPGGTSPSAVETRMRIRYAVLSALTTGMYSPDSPDTLKHLAILDKGTYKGSVGNKVTNDQVDYADAVIVPYERFVRDGSDALYDDDTDTHWGEVLVLWIDAKQIRKGGRRPLHSLRQILRNVRQQAIQRCVLRRHAETKDAPSQQLQVRVIGPNNTDMLFAVSKRAELARKARSIVIWFCGVLGSVRDASTAAIRQIPGRKNGRANEAASLFCTRLLSKCGLLDCMRDLPGDGAFFRPNINVCWYGCRATVEPAGLKNSIGEDVKAFTDRKTPGISVTAEQHSNRHPPFFTNVIGTDWHLAWALRLELKARHKWPASNVPNECIVLVTEKDTLYGRALPHLFSRLLSSKLGGAKSVPPPLLVYKYVRGVDGEASGHESANTKKAPSGNRRNSEDDVVTGFAPVGNSQLDYLRRLETELSVLNRRQREAGGRGILAIGLVGTDVYDKLLALRALRGRFPNAAFFTTDLDAEFSRRSELPYTQNLIVASHFGLQLHPSLQRDAPPFRDSYQTAGFLATLLAVSDDRARHIIDKVRRVRPGDWHNLWPTPHAKDGKASEGKYPRELLDVCPYDERNRGTAPRGSYLRPLVFEIGLSGAYQLTRTGETRLALPSKRRATLSHLWLNKIVQAPGPRDRVSPQRPWRTTFEILACVGTFLVLVYFCVGSARNTVACLGKSVIIAVKLVPAVAVLGYSHLRRRARGRLANPEDQNEGTPPADRSRNTLTGILGEPRWKTVKQCAAFWIPLILLLLLGFMIRYDHFHGIRGEPASLFQGISVWPSTVIRFIAAVLGLLYCVKISRNLREKDNELFGKLPDDPCPGNDDSNDAASADAHRRNVVSRALAFAASLPTRVARLFSCDWKKDQSEEKFEPNLLDYRCKSSIANRWRRVTLVGGTYVVFSATLLLLSDSYLPFVEAPARSDVARWSSIVILNGLCLVYLATTLLVVDAQNLCRRLVQYVGAGRCFWPDNVTAKAELGAIAWKNGKTPPCIMELVSMRVIARWTAEAGRIQKWPFLILFLLLAAHHRIFDAWHVNLAVVTVILLPCIASVYQSTALRNEARKARERALERLRDERLKHPEKEEEEEKEKERERERIDELVHDIEIIRDGAFKPIGEDYLLQSLAIPFGGTSLMALAQRLMS